MKTTGVDVKSGLGWPDDNEIEIETEPHFNKIRITLIDSLYLLGEISVTSRMKFFFCHL